MTMGFVVGMQIKSKNSSVAGHVFEACGPSIFSQTMKLQGFFENVSRERRLFHAALCLKQWFSTGGP